MVYNGTRLTGGSDMARATPYYGKRNKTKKMLEVEERLGEQLECALPELVTENGLSATADYLGVSKATLGYWLLKLDIIVRRVAISPRDTLFIRRDGKSLEEIA